MFLMTLRKCGATILSMGPGRTPVIALFLRDGVFWFLALVGELISNLCLYECSQWLSSGFHCRDSALGQSTSDFGPDSCRVCALLRSPKKHLTFPAMKSRYSVGTSLTTVSPAYKNPD
jgi:hypothetical protein